MRTTRCTNREAYTFSLSEGGWVSRFRNRVTIPLSPFRNGADANDSSSSVVTASLTPQGDGLVKSGTPSDSKGRRSEVVDVAVVFILSIHNVSNMLMFQKIALLTAALDLEAQRKRARLAGTGDARVDPSRETQRGNTLFGNDGSGNSDHRNPLPVLQLSGTDVYHFLMDTVSLESSGSFGRTERMGHVV